MSEPTIGEASLYQIRLAGLGGQGVVLASRILGDALSREGYNVLQTQAYGIEARGGASCGEVLYGTAEINSLRVTAPDILLALSPAALTAYRAQVPPSGLIFYDTYMIKTGCEDADRRVYGLPFTNLALSNLGSDMYTNIIALGFMNGIAGIVSRKNLEDAVEEQVQGQKANNMTALQLGYLEADKNVASRT